MFCFHVLFSLGLVSIVDANMYNVFMLSKHGFISDGLDFVSGKIIDNLVVFHNAFIHEASVIASNCG